MTKPFVWQMIKEAVEHLNGKASYADIKAYINKKWQGVNNHTVNDQIQVLTVNRKSRIHYPENHKPRLTNSGSAYDLLYTTGRGQVVAYNSTQHGIWEIYKNGNNKLGVRQFNSNTSQNTYLFVWNPKKWSKWADASNEPYIEKNIEELNNTGKVTVMWSCTSHKSVRPGDRAFLARVGEEPKGIFAAGYVASEPFLSKHWSGENKEVHRVLIDFEVLLNPDKEPILTLDKLENGNLDSQTWTPQSSGISVKPEVVEELEKAWFEFLTTQKIRHNPYSPTDNESEKTFTEGGVSQVTQTRYERNLYARTACIKHYGYACSVCKFDFEKQYGELGQNFIHVHHLTQVASVGKEYEVNPITDLRPVCPNCHAMLHKRNPPLTIEELKAQLK